jgi:hypothetical protein
MMRCDREWNPRRTGERTYRGRRRSSYHLNRQIHKAIQSLVAGALRTGGA